MKYSTTRRQFLVAATVGVTWPWNPTLAFPDDSPPVDPPPFVDADPPYGIGVSFDDSLASILGVSRLSLAEQLATALGRAPGASAPPVSLTGAVMLTAGPTPPSWERVELSRVPLVPVVSPRLQVTSLPAEHLADVLGGNVTNWKSLGSYANVPLALYGLGPLAALGDPRLVVSPDRTLSNVDDLAKVVLNRPGALAFVPLPALTPLLKPLPIGAIDAAAGHGPLDAYPLNATLVVGVAPGAAPETLAAVQAFAGALRAAQGPPSYTVLMLGDVIQGRDVHLRMVAARDFQLPFRRVAPWTTTADLTLADNECDYSDTLPNPVDRDPHTFQFVTKTAAADGLKLAGVRGVSLANNHSMNMGHAGLVDTLAALDARGILHTGAGLNLAEARTPAIFNVKGMRIALLGYNGISASLDGASDDGAGTVPMDLQILRDDMDKAIGQADVVIPFFHWSVEYTSVPTPQQVEFAHAAIDLGAEVVIGSHPHWVQSTEIYRGKQIIYSLGNFVFDQEWSLETKQGVMAELLMLGGRCIGVRLIPTLITNYSTPHIATPAEAAPVFSHIWKATDDLPRREAAQPSSRA